MEQNVLEIKQVIGMSGYNGFIGSALLSQSEKYDIILFGRSKPTIGDLPFVNIELSSSFDFNENFKGITTFIHIAARVHVMNESGTDALPLYRMVNTDGTLNLAQQAAAAGVKRFIFISTVKVNGEETLPGDAFSAMDVTNPTDPYGISKAEAEAGLRQIAAETGMEVVIIRPPLVYGPGVKANFAAMLKLAKKNLPLPLGAIHNKRSMVALDNLVDLIVTCIDHPKAANQTFLVSDDRDVSTTELLQLMTKAAGGKPRLIPVPASWLRLLGKLTGKQAIIDRLCGNLQLDITHTKQTLGWKPVVTVEEGIRRCLS